MNKLCLLLQRYTFWSNSQPFQTGTPTGHYCACYCKDTHFEAIHNFIDAINNTVGIVLATAKIHILKQFTTIQRITTMRFYCACYCKDTHFEAIHNRYRSTSYPCDIVLATAKIHILKQFTTILSAYRSNFILCLLLQRYTFWSNSQPCSQALKALRWLCLLLQRYTFWSNSQQVEQPLALLENCACYCKDTHFEAIHNDNRKLLERTEIVLATAKIHILKQFTTTDDQVKLLLRLCLLLQRYTFWSNSQRVFLDKYCKEDCACYCKDTHFEAIHNYHREDTSNVLIVLATAKIHILKQFTTMPWRRHHHQALCLLLQRYTFWSNSQLRLSDSRTRRNCACYCKDTHFEAIHNARGQTEGDLCIVLATAKIHILKQFTTCEIC